MRSIREVFSRFYGREGLIPSLPVESLSQRGRPAPGLILATFFGREGLIPSLSVESMVGGVLYPLCLLTMVSGCTMTLNHRLDLEVPRRESIKILTSNECGELTVEVR